MKRILRYSSRQRLIRWAWIPGLLAVSAIIAVVVLQGGDKGHPPVPSGDREPLGTSPSPSATATEPVSTGDAVPSDLVAQAEPDPEIVAAVSSILASTSPAQAEKLADHVVTYEEYEQAIAGYIECRQAAGATPLIRPGEGQRPTSVAFRIPGDNNGPTVDSAAEARAEMQRCSARHLSEVDAIWAMQQSNLAADQAVAELYDLMEACLAQPDPPISDLPGSPRLRHYPNAPDRPMELPQDWRDHYDACADEIAAKTGLLAPIPMPEDRYACLEEHPIGHPARTGC